MLSATIAIVKLTLKIVLAVVVVCVFINDSSAQAKTNGYVIKSNIILGFSSHSNNPVQFPIGYTDASITPHLQQSNLGYQISITGLRELSKVLSIGLSASISKFGFTETGDELSFWSNEIYQYSIAREFKMYGFGLSTGINILNNNVNMLSIFVCAKYEEFISTKGVYLWSDSYNKSKFASDISVEYGHLLTANTYLTMGLNSVVSLNDFFETIKYKPVRWGISIGINYKVH